MPRYEGEIDYSVVVEETFAKFRSEGAKDWHSKFATHSGLNHVEAQVLDRVALLHPETFRAFERSRERHGGALRGARMLGKLLEVVMLGADQIVSKAQLYGGCCRRHDQPRDAATLERASGTGAPSTEHDVQEALLLASALTEHRLKSSEGVREHRGKPFGPVVAREHANVQGTKAKVIDNRLDARAMSCKLAQLAPNARRRIKCHARLTALARLEIDDGPRHERLRVYG